MDRLSNYPRSIQRTWIYRPSCAAGRINLLHSQDLTMNQQILASVCEQVYRRFPQVTGSRPTVQNRPGSQFLLIFHGSSQAADGRTVAHTIRVVASEAGKIIKITSSR